MEVIMNDDILVADGFLEEPSEATEGKSAKAIRRQQRKEARRAKQDKRNPKPLEPRTDRQSLYINSIKNSELTIAIGPAGAGKTYVPSRIYGEMAAAGEISKVYIARPNVSKAKHRNGFLPGSAEEKTAPWLVPIFEGLSDAMGSQTFQQLKNGKVFEEVPFEFIQGRTFKDAACIVDEAENLDLDDLYITLTRQGENLRMVLAGDIHQARIPNSGLAEVVQMARMDHMEGNSVIEFTEDDIVRSRQARQWAKAFRNHWADGGDASGSVLADMPLFERVR
jgi:phosphate starvation-inducible PhoH-like protein